MKKKQKVDKVGESFMDFLSKTYGVTFVDCTPENDEIFSSIPKKRKNNAKSDEKSLKEFLMESNAIEGVFGLKAYKDARKAWDYLNSKTFITPEVILGTHNFIAKNLRPDIAGFWRTCDVWIGGKCKPFISVQLIEDDVKNFITDMGTSPELPKEDLERFTKNSHIQFEAIHPFEDFNGRVGRLIYNWHRQKLGLPIHIIHADWDTGGEEQKNYYKWFR